MSLEYKIVGIKC